jgi:hypothetical protein
MKPKNIGRIDYPNLSGEDMKRCTRCILPETYPKIKFDHQGKCNYCIGFQPVTYDHSRLFSPEFLLHRSLHDYDCLVPLSGGRDSSFVLYQVVRNYGLRALAYNYDNMFMDSVARENLQNITSKLGVPLVQSSSYTHRISRLSFLKINLRRSPLYFVYCLCYGCPNAIWGGAWRVAKSMGVDLIIMGESKEENAAYKGLHQNMITTNLPEKVGMLIKKPFWYLCGKFFHYFFSKSYPDKNLVGNEIRIVNFFDRYPYNENRILDVLKTEIGWKSDKDTNWRFDCSIHSLVLQMTYQLMGMTEWDDLYSVLIRKGEITREEALHRVEKFEKYRERLLPKNNDILKKLGLNSQERKKILDFCDGPPRLRNSWQ